MSLFYSNIINFDSIATKEILIGTEVICYRCVKVIKKINPPRSKFSNYFGSRYKLEHQITKLEYCEECLSKQSII